MRISRQALPLVDQTFDQIVGYNGDEKDVQRESQDQSPFKHRAKNYQFRDARPCPSYNECENPHYGFLPFPPQRLQQTLGPFDCPAFSTHTKTIFFFSFTFHHLRFAGYMTDSRGRFDCVRKIFSLKPEGHIDKADQNRYLQ